MIKEAINRILELADPHIIEINGDQYSDKPLNRVMNELRASSINMTTLSSLVDYIKANKDLKGIGYIVHIVSPTEVQLISSLDCDRKRETLAIVNAEVPEFPFNREVEHEKFLIGVQSKFVEGKNDDKAIILKFAGTVTNGSVAEYGDDGISQKATVKHGVASKAEAIVPSPCTLTPYRTFTEVDQPSSQFIFRLSEGRDGEIHCALYEADGGAWKSAAKANIRKYLADQLDSLKDILIVS